MERRGVIAHQFDFMVPLFYDPPFYQLILSARSSSTKSFLCSRIACGCLKIYRWLGPSQRFGCSGVKSGQSVFLIRSADNSNVHEVQEHWGEVISHLWGNVLQAATWQPASCRLLSIWGRQFWSRGALWPSRPYQGCSEPSFSLWWPLLLLIWCYEYGQLLLGQAGSASLEQSFILIQSFGGRLEGIRDSREKLLWGGGGRSSGCVGSRTISTWLEFLNLWVPYF